LSLQQNNQVKFFIIANQVFSTNDSIRSYPEDTVFISESQSSGRGQFGRNWFSPTGNLYFSLKINQNKFSQIQENLVTRSCFVALVQGINQYKKDFDLEKICKQKLFFKAPNDLLNQENKKLAGILVEKFGSSLVIGIGVNFKSLEFSGQGKNLKKLKESFGFFNWGEKKDPKKFSLYLAKAIYDLEKFSNQRIIDFIEAYEKK